MPCEICVLCVCCVLVRDVRFPVMEVGSIGQESGIVKVGPYHAYI